MGEGRSELIAGNAKHLCTENEPRRINSSHISNGYLERSTSQGTVKEKVIHFCQKGEKRLEGTTQKSNLLQEHV